MADASSGVIDSERTDGARRAARNAGRLSAKYAERVVIGKPGTSDDVDTYRAGFELIVRALAVQLEMQEIYQERGAVGIGGMDVSGRPVMSSRMTYTNEAFLPHLREIRSLEDIQRYAPYRADYRMVLSVHPEDEQDAYGVLRELENRLSARCTTLTSIGGRTLA